MRHSRQELIEHLKEQREWLQSSAREYDRGSLSEAKRLASIVRTLVVDSAASHALLVQLGVREQLQFADAAGGDHSATIFAVSLAGMEFGPAGFGYAPSLGEIEEKIEFDPWWTNVVIKAPEIGTFSRERIVKALANKDGGSHVDPKLPASYRSLSRQNGIGWVVNDGSGDYSPLSNPVLPAMRTIAHEIELTLNDQLSALL